MTMTNLSPTKGQIRVRYIGPDSWGRPVFKDEEGTYYKSTELDPEGGYPNASPEEKGGIWLNLCTSEPSNDPEGEPGYIVASSMFELVE